MPDHSPFESFSVTAAFIGIMKTGHLLPKPSPRAKTQTKSDCFGTFTVKEPILACRLWNGSRQGFVSLFANATVQETKLSHDKDLDRRALPHALSHAASTVTEASFIISSPCFSREVSGPMRIPVETDTVK